MSEASCTVPTEEIRPTYELRSYQKELVQPVLEKKNCIICAPTGSGKTVVAGHIIGRHVAEHPNARVCFIVPSITLLQQQKKVCEGFLHKSDIISVICGDSNCPFVPTILASKLVILTPQMLVNALKPNQDPLDTIGTLRKFRLSMFSLMIFDECHHTNEKHPYNAVMKQYHAVNHSGDLAAGETLPQIVGLTASLGVGCSKNVESAIRHIVKLCANLDVCVISSVQSIEGEGALNKISGQREDEIKFCDPQENPYLTVHFMQMSNIEMTILSIPEVKSNPELSRLLTFDGEKNKLSPAYLQWIFIALNSTLPEFKDLSPESRNMIMNHFNHLRALFRKMELYIQFDKDSAIMYYRHELQRITVPKHIAETMRAADFAFGNVKSVMLIDLFELLQQHFKDSRSKAEAAEGQKGDLDPRVMIFLKERDYANILKGLICQDERLRELGVRADILISTNRGGDTSLTNQQFREKLRLFAMGDVNVLCVTSVAEEGLDVSQCNLVIKYNYASNDIAHVQRKGRARQMNSRCVLFTHDPNIKAQEHRNIAYEELAAEAIKEIRSKPQNWLQQQVKELISVANIQHTELYEESTAKKRKLQSSNTVYELRCRQCDELISTSLYVRHQNNSLYFVCDPQIWKRVRALPLHLYSRFAQDQPQVQCSKCSNEWGRIVLAYGRVPIPIIKCKNIVLVDHNGTRKAVSKWCTITESYFEPNSLQPNDVTPMCAAEEIPGFIEEQFRNLTLH